MKKKRLIPVLLLKNGWIVQSKSFTRHKNLGNPITAVKRLSQWASDELIYLDISTTGSYDLRRDDLNHPNRSNLLEIISDVSKETFMPITVGGGIKHLSDIEVRLSSGADKIAINTEAFRNPKIINEAAKEFGSQCIVVSIDFEEISGKNLVVINSGLETTELSVTNWCSKVEELGAGEILVNSTTRDGLGGGYNLEVLSQITEKLKIPVIAQGGVGKWDHFGEALSNTDVDAVAAANIFHFYDQSVFIAKRWLFKNGFNVRKPELFNS